jgi:hypothetical protein
MTLNGISTNAVASVLGEGRGAAEGDGDGGAAAEAAAAAPASPGEAGSAAAGAAAEVDAAAAAGAAFPRDRLLPEYAQIRTLLPVRLVSMVTCTGKCEGPHSLE